MSLDEQLAGMTCRQVLESLSDFVDGELADDTRRRVEAHVAACSNCERFGGMFANIVREIRASHDRADEPLVFERLRHRLERS